MRKAFNETMKDKDFLAEAEKLQLPIEPTDGASLDKLAKQVVASPPTAIELAKKVLGE